VKPEQNIEKAAQHSQKVIKPYLAYFSVRVWKV